MSSQIFEKMPDVMDKIDNRRLDIQRVGVRSVRRPMNFRDRKGGIVPTIGNFGTYVRLDNRKRGTHMSRFIQLLEEIEEPLSVESFIPLVKSMIKRLESVEGVITVDFPFFLVKNAPITAIAGHMDYDVGLTGFVNKQNSRMQLTLRVPVSTLCPCSREISEYGAHNQRSSVRLTIQTNLHVWVTDLIELIEKSASCDLFSVLKRPDEKFVTEYAYDNPKFVEDIVRDIARTLTRDNRILFFEVESENFESIHNHSAYAYLRHGTPFRPLEESLTDHLNY
ncbi:GTP cyclohydrolase FolE2 [Candidatus Ichthyocystis hellenicum]|uniref:GTP cyclohydrolase FolE2 n=1 Tax=Candidatus Ichthyocystis hellenicum TaxID=1561003 RepID=UPI000B86201A|nr:GTP cyclohydrolase FolE2 [Candidatus Ichthyocystis hellenicum]